MTHAPQYEQDFYAWGLAQARLLQNKRFEGLDLDHLIGEIEGLAKRERRELRTHYRELIVILLAITARKELRQSGKVVETIRLRDAIIGLEQDSPTLKKEAMLLIHEGYARARLEASLITSLPLESFPEECPYTLTQLHDDYYIP